MQSFMKLFRIGAVSALVALISTLALPHSRYIRFQDVRVEAYARLGWIYERIHFDNTPIDIAFVGTSHTLNGIDAEAVADKMSKVSNRFGAGRVHATNLAIPGYGRNLHWLIVRELLENRRVGTLVLEIFENETRKPHPLFVYAAEVSDVIGAPVLINLNYFYDIARLPFRQISLAAKSLWPEQFGLKSHFNPSRYDGETVDNTRFVQVNGQRLSPYRDQRFDPEKLDRIAESRREQKNLSILGRPLKSFEYRLPRYYVSKIIQLSEQKGVPIKFLYLPGYGWPQRPYDTSLYEGHGDLITVNDILAKKENWSDMDHLNVFGAAELSMRLAELLAPQIGPVAGAISKNEAPDRAGSR
jgi:hypothetical protein